MLLAWDFEPAFSAVSCQIAYNPLANYQLNVRSDWLLRGDLNIGRWDSAVFPSHLINVHVYNIQQIFLHVGDCSTCITWLNIPKPKLGTIPKFQNCACCKKCFKDNKHNNLHAFGTKKSSDIFPWTLSVSQSSQLRSRKTVRFSEQIMSSDKSPRTFRAKW